MREEAWYKNADLLRERLAEHGSWVGLSRATGVPQSTLKTAASKLSVLLEETARRETGEVSVDVDSMDDLEGTLRKRGMRLSEWIVVRATVNEWQGFYRSDVGAEVVPLRQLKVYLRPRVNANMLVPAEVKALRPPRARAAVRRPSRLVFIYGDDQRPNVDRGFEGLKIEWLRDNQPDDIIDLGDGMDFPSVSGHKVNPAAHWTVQECANDYATWLYAARCAAPNASFRILADNHVTGRLRDYQLARAADLYGVHPADIEGLESDDDPLWSVRRLLRLDEMGIEYIAPPGDTNYAESQYEVVPGELVALHGYRTGANLGKKFLDDYGCSVIYGHQHGQDVHVTDVRRRGVGERHRLYAIGVGCGALVHGGGGYAPGADWQNCALTVSVFPDGGWTFDYLSYENGILRWRDKQYG